VRAIDFLASCQRQVGGVVYYVSGDGVLDLRTEREPRRCPV